MSIHFTNANSIHVVAPHGGAQARFVTNPFTVGIPRTGRDPLLLDFATSAIAHGKARVAYNKKVPVPPGSLIDSEGRPTTDPAAVFESPAGALLTFAGHKGYALAMVCEMLGAALTGGDTSRPVDEDVSLRVWNSMLTIVFDPARIGSLEVFEREAAAFEDWVRSSKLAPGSDAIRMPGDPERESRKARADGIDDRCADGGATGRRGGAGVREPDAAVGDRQRLNDGPGAPSPALGTASSAWRCSRRRARLRLPPQHLVRRLRSGRHRLLSQFLPLVRRGGPRVDDRDRLGLAQDGR